MHTVSTLAAGSFIYDDVTQTIASWSVRVGDGPWHRGFTCVPGNSSAYTASTYASQWLAAQGTLYFDWALGGTTVPYRRSVECFYCTPWEYDDRVITASSLVLTLLPAPVAIVQVDEFHNACLQHYFITANAAEKNDLDTGVHPGWTRTGQSFKAYVAGFPAC